MQLTSIGWMFTLGVLAHNTEEAVYLPAWSVQAGKWYAPVSNHVFRFAVLLLSGLFILITATATFSPAGSVGAYLMAGYVLAMLLNVFMPHLMATVFMCRYMPGTATAVVLNLPLGLFYLHQVLFEARIDLHVFFWAGPLVVLAILATIPALFALGRKLFPTAA